MANQPRSYTLRMFLTVQADFQPEGLNLCCWMSPVDSFLSEIKDYPHSFLYNGDGCDWMIHSNIELTPKVRAAICEYAEKICEEQRAQNARRKLANR